MLQASYVLQFLKKIISLHHFFLNLGRDKVLAESMGGQISVSVAFTS